MKGKLLFLLASLFLLVSCATITPEPDGQPAFGPDRKEDAVKEIRENKNQNAGSVFRYSVDLEIETLDQGRQKIAAMALWQPDKAIRWRKSLTSTTASSLPASSSMTMGHATCTQAFATPRKAASV